MRSVGPTSLAFLESHCVEFERSVPEAGVAAVRPQRVGNLDEHTDFRVSSLLERESEDGHWVCRVCRVLMYGGSWVERTVWCRDNPHARQVRHMCTCVKDSFVKQEWDTRTSVEEGSSADGIKGARLGRTQMGHSRVGGRRIPSDTEQGVALFLAEKERASIIFSWRQLSSSSAAKRHALS